MHEPPLLPPPPPSAAVPTKEAVDSFVTLAAKPRRRLFGYLVVVPDRSVSPSTCFQASLDSGVDETPASIHVFFILFALDTKRSKDLPNTGVVSLLKTYFWT